MQLGVDGDVLQRRQAEPLVTEVPGQPAELGVLAHARDLLLEDLGPEQLAVGSEVEQLIVGHGGPEEIGEAGGQFVGVEPAGLLGLGLG